MVDNYKDERVAEVRKEVSRRLKIWLDSNRILPDFAQPLEGSLLSAIQTAHPQLRACQRAEGRPLGQSELQPPGGAWSPGHGK